MTISLDYFILLIFKANIACGFAVDEVLGLIKYIQTGIP